MLNRNKREKEKKRETTESKAKTSKNKQKTMSKCYESLSGLEDDKAFIFVHWLFDVGYLNSFMIISLGWMETIVKSFPNEFIWLFHFNHQGCLNHFW